MKTTYTLTVTNEGQPLNYIETFTGTKRELAARVKAIREGLSGLLPQGSFEVEVES